MGPITAAAGLRQFLSGAGQDFDPGLLRERVDVSGLVGQTPYGIARTPLLITDVPSSMHGQATPRPMIWRSMTCDDLATSWAILTGLPHRIEVFSAPDHEGTLREIYSRVGKPCETMKWNRNFEWREELIHAIILVTPHDLIEWIFCWRERDAKVFEALLRLDLKTAIELAPELLEDDWKFGAAASRRPSLAPQVPPFVGLGLYAEFIRIAQLQRATIWWTFSGADRALRANDVLRTAEEPAGKTHAKITGKRGKGRRAFGGHPGAEPLLGMLPLTSIGLGVPGTEYQTVAMLRDRCANLALFGNKDSIALANWWKDESPIDPVKQLQTTPDYQAKVRSSDRSEVLPMGDVVRFWGLSYKDVAGVLLLDLAAQARRLAGRPWLNKAEKAETNRAAYTLDIIWLERGSRSAFKARKLSVIGGQSHDDKCNPDEVRTPLDLASEATASRRIAAWAKVVKALPKVGESGALCRARPELWWQDPPSEDVAHFESAKAEHDLGQAEFADFLVGSKLDRLRMLAAADPRSLSAMARRQLVTSASALHAKEHGGDELALAAAIDLSITISPLSLDPRRKLTDQKRRKICSYNPGRILRGSWSFRLKEGAHLSPRLLGAARIDGRKSCNDR